MTPSHRRAGAALLMGLGLLLLGLLGSCRSRARAAEAPAMPVGGTYYSQFGLQHEKDRFRTTNYRVGELLPINTEVTLVDITAKQAVVETVDGWQLVIQNMPRHTDGTMVEEFERIFAPEPVDLRAFSEQELSAIEQGVVEVGMTVEAVVAAIGYPPASGTKSLDLPQWKYWTSRFKTFVVAFDENWIVTGITQ